MVILENGKELEGKYAKNYLNSIKYKKANRYSYQQYWAKIQAKLNGIKKIYLSVDGVYNSLNINTLYNIETQKYLGEELEIQLLSNSKDLITAKTNNTPIKNATLIGFPDYNSPPNPNSVKNENPTLPHIKNDSTQRFFNGDNITELLGTKTEVNNLESILQKKGIKTDKYLAAQATEELVKKLNNPQILHIATHGFFLQDIEDKKDEARGFMGMDTKKIAENPLLRSGLLFANAKTALQEGCDGILTAYEAMNLNLDNTDLVVMSACETGLGEIKNGEGVYGLQRAFQQAGAKTVLMSLWTVSDEATQELMTLFYQNLITKKQSKRLAFQNAQNELKKKFPEPYYWGAFVMVGE
jgi:CHAT domain-containing protein